MNAMRRMSRIAFVSVPSPAWPSVQNHDHLISDVGFQLWEPARPLQRSLGPFGPEMPKKSRKCLPGPPGPRKVSKKSRESPESLRKVLKESFRTVPETFWRLFGVPGPEAPGDIFETFLASRARRARETSVRGGLVPNSSYSPHPQLIPPPPTLLHRESISSRFRVNFESILSRDSKSTPKRLENHRQTTRN